MVDLNVSRAVVPIVKLGPDDEEIRSLLGTGFYVGPMPALVTAAHVFRDHPCEPKEDFGFIFLPPRPGARPRVARINEFVCSEEYDISVASASGTPGALSLAVAREEIACNEDVISLDFSPTQIRWDGDELHIDLHPYTHKGNILRYHTSTFTESRPTRVLYTSYPAMQGASGAPVVRAADFSVVGILVGNLERQLMPAQIVRVETDNDIREEVKYFLPMGKGLSSRVLHRELLELGVEPELVD